ncbi:hypothetical protein BN7_5979 [Wickerhamomyces ciferrii]|uniref:Uncharacterized protein n=1 Tax=Wickerhamomyces ciferrii (strain ATCC 14091 / BCRC 22168 / CBS 111 / JCM 3599 / NBRC 0793 / NRRL Y-1031 F-60-10) TaxID=1206466 RepID=K0KTA2_WICCF|nr:uncharacterized protein BN7_5979 [Wickerhamomyces ciferrii]CCH46386.1 hypothetical protein BN7_5979 [Wickerhamomyces ciferrii]
MIEAYTVFVSKEIEDIDSFYPENIQERIEGGDVIKQDFIDDLWVLILRFEREDDDDRDLYKILKEIDYVEAVEEFEEF